MPSEQTEVIQGNGFAAGSLDGMGGGYGFRKIRHELGVQEMGINAIVIPPGLETGTHWHDRQEEVYFVYQGQIQFTLGENDEDSVTLGPGGVIRVSPSTQRSIKNVGDGDATYMIVGAAGGYVGRDGNHREGEDRVLAGR
ncbi:MAG: cupin domain-containing protein [Solirubrobacterales bacterium]